MRSNENCNVKMCALLKEQDNILILTHAHPDGDTLGCGFGLCRALIKMGKKARVINADEIPAKYSYLYNGMSCLNFKEDYVAAVDVATENLLGSLADTYSGRINLCTLTITEQIRNMQIIFICVKPHRHANWFMRL